MTRTHRPKTAFVSKSHSKNVHFNESTESKEQCFPRKTIRSAPAHKRKPNPTVLPKNDFHRMTNTTKVPTIEERYEQLKQYEKDVAILAQESQCRRQFFKELDNERNSEIVLQSITDETALSNKLKLLDKAFLAKQEQEEEVKQANRIILNAKCNIIRNAQIQERLELNERFRHEEKRLDDVMLLKAKKSLEADDMAVEKEKGKKMEYSKEIQQQVRDREMLKYVELERREEEARLIAKTEELLAKEEERKKKEFAETRERFRFEMNKIKEVAEVLEKNKNEQIKVDEVRRGNFLKQKEEFNKRVAKERRLRALLFSKRQEKMFQLGKVRMESNAGIEEIHYTRTHENLEREYRKKEKESALKRKKLEEEILKARQRQIHEQKEKKAIQMSKNEKDFQKAVEILEKEESKQKDKERMQFQSREKYREEIMKQVKQRQHERQEIEIQLRKEFLARKAKEIERENNIRAVIQSKLNTMREANLPEKYIKEVEKQLKRITINDSKKL